MTKATQAMGYLGDSLNCEAGCLYPRVLKTFLLGPQDVLYLHFLEGTRNYEWLEAIFLNQTMANTKLSWFR